MDFKIKNGVLEEYNGSGGDVVIPDGVTAIGNEAFYECKKLTSIIIPDSVTSIGDRAFCKCSSLTSITIPDGVAYIGVCAFYGCKGLADANGFIIVRDVLHYYCGNGGNIVIPSGVTAIGACAFYECKKLTSITIPDSVTTIGDEAFRWCGRLTSITIPDGVTSIGDEAFWGCSRLTSVTIPDGVTTIGDRAFYNCSSLTSITIPDSVITIGNDAFRGCEGLADANGFVIVRDVLHYYCGNGGNIVIPSGVTAIGACAFYECKKLTSITIPAGVTAIGDSAFCDCSRLTSVTIPDGVTTIGDRAFYDCSSLTNISIPDSVTTIGKEAFSGHQYYWSSLKSVKLSDSITSISEGMFDGCRSLTSITIPDSVTSIGKHAFRRCDSLTSITIPDNVTRIGPQAFADCENLIQFSFPRSKCKIGKDPFGSYLPDELTYFPDDLYEHFTDSALINCLLADQNQWDKLELNLQTNIFMACNTEKLLPFYMNIIHDPEAMGKAILTRISEKSSEKECDSVANFLCIFGETALSENSVQGLYDALKPLKSAKRALKTIEANATLMMKLNSESSSVSEQERILANILQSEKRSTLSVTGTLKEYYGLKMSDLPKLSFTDGTQAPDRVFAYLLTVCEIEDYGYSSSVFWEPDRCENAKKVLELLDPKSFQSALQTLADENLGFACHNKKMFLAYPICRYADDKLMDELLKEAPHWRSSVSGNDAPPLRTFRDACLYSDYRPVMMFADKYGDLERYAAIRGTDAQTIRDTIMADLGFDTEGKKQYDLGGTTVVVTLEKDCSLSLLDTKTGKTVKSIPKRGNDEALVTAAAKDLSDIKKNVKKIVKNRSAILFTAFRKGTAQDAKYWKKVYIENPVLRTVANLIVWQQGKETFILRDTCVIHADGTPYTIGDDPIFVAHPMEMTHEDVAAWQNYFLNNSLKQPFAQIWEPVIRPEEVKPDRYAGVQIPYVRFLNQEKHGISTEDEGYHEYFSVTFEDCNASATGYGAHYITSDITIEVKEFSFKKYTRQVNHIVAFLDKATIYNRILKDDPSVAQYLKNLTLAQVTKFLDVAVQNSCTNVTAILLEYKNKNFPNIDPLAEFTLEDW